MIAMPTAINNFIPGISLGLDYELGAATVPLLTFFDLFCILGIIRYKLIANFNKTYIKLLLITSSCVFLFHMLNSVNFQNLLLLISGSWQLRYIFYFYIITQNFSKISFVLIYKAIVFSTLFLICESIIFTYLNGISDLTSGSLGTNSFGNYLSAVALFIFLSRNKIKTKFNLPLIFIILISVLLTDTRAAVLALLFIALCYWIKTKTFLKIIIISFCVFVSYNNLPNKYKIFSLITYSQAKDIIQFGADFNNNNMDITPENSPLVSRIKLYATSSRMIYENPFFGIGPRLWNIKKYDYGFETPVLIDSHNGYLNILSEYGIIAGILLLYLLFYPFINFNKYFNYSPLISFTYLFMITELSNSGTYKYQIFSLLVFCSFIFYNNQKFLKANKIIAN
jgi:O-antigen ligase